MKAIDKKQRIKNRIAEKRASIIMTSIALYLTPLILLIVVVLSVFDIKPVNSASRWIELPLIPQDILSQHFAAIIGLPSAALLSLWIVIILRNKTGPIEFNVLGFQFKGASGPIVLWIICFLAISFAIKLLW